MGMKAKVALGAVVGIVVIGAVSANAGGDGKGGGDKGGAKGSSASAEHTSGGKKDSDGAQAAEEKKAAFGGDGEYQVGSDVQPGDVPHDRQHRRPVLLGARQATPPASWTPCSPTTTSAARVTWTVKPTDKLFKSRGCADWEAVDPKAKGTPGSSMDGDGGMYKVGTDIAPGTYRSTGNADDSCYWERTKDADHGLDSIIANNNVTGTAVVTISPSDAYFKTSGCGDWKKA